MATRWLFGWALFFCLSACTSDTHFGRSTWNEVKEFSVSGQSGGTVIDKDNDSVSLTVTSGVDRSSMVPMVFEISNFASVSPGKDVPQDFTVPVEYVVQAENGESRVWTVTIGEIGEDPQLANTGFDLWYETSAGAIGTPIIYDEPGESASNTIWATANFGLTKYKTQPNTTPVDLGGGDFAAKMETVVAPAIVPLAAATMFAGVFELNEFDPASSAKFGTPFTGKPTGFKVNYAYVPGSNLVGVTADECDIYLLLEKRDGTAVARVATGWFRDGTDTGLETWTSLEVTLKYGPLSPSDPEYDYANIKGGDTWAEADEVPTHISVVFASSALGDEYKGAIGSVLVVDDLELIYD